MPGLTQNTVQKPLKRARAVSDQYYGQAIGQTKKSYGEAKGYQQPWQDFGQNALQDYEKWRTDPNAITSDPSYQWRLNEGLRGVENSAAARGGVLSGNALRAIIDYGQGAASDEYGSEFARRMKELGIGQSASDNMSNLATGEGNALSNLLVGRGQNWFDTYIRGSAETRAAELALNSVIQSWVPSSYGGKAGG